MANEKTKGTWEKIVNLIEGNLESCDLLFSFFNSALNSYRSDSRVRPFPSAYLRNDGEKDIDSLRNLCRRIPTFPDMLKQRLEFRDKSIEFLDWLFTYCDPRTLELVNYSDVPLPKLVGNINYQRPKYVFAVKYQDDKAWLKKRGSFNTFFAFHGSKLENFYSIYRVGLQQIFSTVTEPLFGEGIYFSLDLQVSILFAPYGLGWKNSMLGDRMSVIALCEIIDDPSKVNRQSSTIGDHNSNQINQARTNSYIIVKDSDLVRVKYFLIYPRKSNKQSMHTLLSHNFVLCFIALFIGLYILRILADVI